MKKFFCDRCGVEIGFMRTYRFSSEMKGNGEIQVIVQNGLPYGMHIFGEVELCDSCHADICKEIEIVLAVKAKDLPDEEYAELDKLDKPALMRSCKIRGETIDRLEGDVKLLVQGLLECCGEHCAHWTRHGACEKCSVMEASKRAREILQENQHHG